MLAFKKFFIKNVDFNKMIQHYIVDSLNKIQRKDILDGKLSPIERLKGLTRGFILYLSDLIDAFALHTGDKAVQKHKYDILLALSVLCTNRHAERKKNDTDGKFFMMLYLAPAIKGYFQSSDIHLENENKLISIANIAVNNFIDKYGLDSVCNGDDFVMDILDNIHKLKRFDDIEGSSYCEDCNDIIAYYTTEQHRIANIHGKKFGYMALVPYCSKCHAEVWNGKINDMNLDTLNLIYDVVSKL